MARITVEDCLKKVNNRFALALLAAKRAKQILDGAPNVVDTKGNKAIVSSLREIAAGKVRYMTPEEVAAQAAELAKRREEQALQAEAARNAAVVAQHAEINQIFETETNLLNVNTGSSSMNGDAEH